MDERIEKVLASIDRYNRGDPKGKEWTYSERLTHWVLQLNPEPSPALRIAARGQHVGRWKIPRESYPMDRGGYLRWREELKRFHAKTVIDLMQRENCPPDWIERVRLIILKKNLSTDAEAQTLEDALCLVFLETQFEELWSKTPDEKMKEIIRKTWHKMSDAGRAMALHMELPPDQHSLVEEALRD